MNILIFKYEKLTLIIILWTEAILAKAQTTISIKDVFKHIGETVNICDSVYTTRALPNLTLINLGADFSKQLLTVVIYKTDVGKFNEPEKHF